MRRLNARASEVMSSFYSGLIVAIVGVALALFLLYRALSPYACQQVASQTATAVALTAGSNAGAVSLAPLATARNASFIEATYSVALPVSNASHTYVQKVLVLNVTGPGAYLYVSSVGANASAVRYLFMAAVGNNTTYNYTLIANGRPRSSTPAFELPPGIYYVGLWWSPAPGLPCSRAVEGVTFTVDVQGAGGGS